MGSRLLLESSPEGWLSGRVSSKTKAKGKGGGGGAHEVFGRVPSSESVVVVVVFLRVWQAARRVRCALLPRFSRRRRKDAVQLGGLMKRARGGVAAV